MAFWLATLNPGGGTRRKRRGLTAWQKAVKRHGGVMQAVRARRGRKRSGKKSRRTLSAWQKMVKKYGGVGGAVKARKKLRRRHTSKFGWNAKSAMKRGRRSRRRGGKHVRRNAMARTRRRRRTRRNAWHGAPRKHRAAALKGWRRRRKSGRVRHKRRSGRRRTVRIPSWARKLKLSTNPRRRSRRRTRRNPILPVSWNGRRPRRRRRNPVVPVSWNGRRRRRSYRRNAVLPFSVNPANAIMGAPGAIINRLKEFVNVGFWTDTALPAVGGFVGSKTLGAMLFGAIDKFSGISLSQPKVAPFLRIASNAAAGAGLAYAAQAFLKNRRMAENIWLGTVVGVAHSILKEVIGGTEIARVVGLDGLGDDLSSRMRAAVAARVNRDLSGMGHMNAYLTQRALAPQNGMSEYVTDTQLRRQPNYAPTPSGQVADYDVARTETAF